MDNTINRKEADLIQYILWALFTSNDPLESIRYVMAHNHSDIDLPDLWRKFILARNIDWLQDLDSAQRTN